VYERGVGITQACGSGACAIGAAATERGLWPAARPMEVRLLGGTLAITVEVDGTIWMEGEAMRVFIGEVSL
jgi:diaminopimelate epimerase